VEDIAKLSASIAGISSEELRTIANHDSKEDRNFFKISYSVQLAQFR